MGDAAMKMPAELEGGAVISSGVVKLRVLQEAGFAILMKGLNEVMEVLSNG